MKSSAEQQYHITGTWTIQNAGKAETRELYITLQAEGRQLVGGVDPVGGKVSCHPESSRSREPSRTRISSSRESTDPMNESSRP